MARRICAGFIGVMLLTLPTCAWAACAPVASTAPRIIPVALPGDDVQITFLGHASFEIVSPAGVRAVTDYNGTNIPATPPDIATMNHAHSTHYTLNPPQPIAHILHGWAEDGTPPSFDLTVGDMHVTNLATNIRTWSGGTEMYGNSIFVFEMAGLCIAHLSHLHHVLQPNDVTALGHIDILMVPVDGMWTLSQQDAAKVVDELQPRIVLPMHYFTRNVLDQFETLEKAHFVIDNRDSPMLTISRETMPPTATIIALPGGY